jgi:Protein of unknown function DUF262
MKNFPHQFNDLTKLYNALLVVKELCDNSIPLTDENFGEMLTRREMYTYRDKSLSIDEYIDNEKSKPVSNRGYLTVARDIRRFFELLNFIELDGNKIVSLRPIANQLLNSNSDENKRDIWKKAFLNLKLTGPEGKFSHPYSILLKLIQKKEKIETAKLMLALEAKDDSDEEFERILNLSSKSVPEIINYIGTTEAMARNAVKILPGIAQQLGDIKREGDSSIYTDEHYIHSMDVEFQKIEIEGTEVEEESEEIQPFDPEKISIDTKRITMDTCLRRLEQGTIFLAPDFQRNVVWDEGKKSRLIESLILNIPIPMFYVSSDEKGNFSVVDGLQRLNTIKSFVLGEDFLESKSPDLRGQGFKLRGLEFLIDEFTNFTFKQLPINIQNRILETEFTFTIINPGTPEEVKRNVFKRINTGGEPLTQQEIRHALYSGKSTVLLYNLSQKKEFLEATDYSVRYIRMLDRELILRFLSFTVRNYTDYSKDDMDRFLSDTMRVINIMPNVSDKNLLKIFPNEQSIIQILVNDIESLERLFVIAMVRAKRIFNKHTFRKSFGKNKKSPINKSLFEVWSVLLSKLKEEEYNMLLSNSDLFLKEYEKLLDEEIFVNSISRDSLKNQAVKYRFEILNNLIKKHIV